MTPDEYCDWRDAALKDLKAKQDGLLASHQLGSWPRFDYDLKQGTLTFSDDHGPRLVAEIQVVGSTSAQDWRWAWANDHLPSEVRSDVERVRIFGADNGIEDFTDPAVRDEDLDALGWEFTAAAARLLEAPGAYRAPSGSGALWVVMRDIRRVS
jgi:hypothetical protein